MRRTITLATPLPTVTGDWTRMSQVFQNLIGRAVKFNDKRDGYVEIDCEELKSIRPNLPSVRVNANARPGNWPGVFISLCCQRVTAIPSPAGALSVPRGRGRARP